jgi:hypothetical protein
MVVRRCPAQSQRQGPWLPTRQQTAEATRFRRDGIALGLSVRTHRDTANCRDLDRLSRPRGGSFRAQVVGWPTRPVHPAFRLESGRG